MFFTLDMGLLNASVQNSLESLNPLFLLAFGLGIAMAVVQFGVFLFRRSLR